MKHITHIIVVSIALVVAGCAMQKQSQASSSAESGVYIVQSGDSLYRIAKMHHLTMEQLKDLNPDMAARLKIGQKLYVLPQVSK
jgi:LysM repeat protein